MPVSVITKDHLAIRLQQNWMAKNPMIEQLAHTKDTLDDSLTSLNWLQNLNMSLADSSSTPATSPPMSREGLHDPSKADPNQVLGMNYSQNSPMSDCRFSHLDSNGSPHLQMEKIDYRTNPYVKPPFSYASLICMAMKDSKKSKITLSAIYSWVTENFMYYRMADPSWQVCKLKSMGM